MAQAAPNSEQSADHGRIRHPVSSLHEVLHAIVSSHFPGGVIPSSVIHSGSRKKGGGTAQLAVGHVMKLSREAALAQRGMLPLLPVDGVCFLPLCLDMPLAPQGPFHVVLHKASVLRPYGAATRTLPPALPSCVCSHIVCARQQGEYTMTSCIWARTHPEYCRFSAGDVHHLCMVEQSLTCALQATDELHDAEHGGMPRFSERFERLKAHLDQHRDIVVLDPLERVQQV